MRALGEEARRSGDFILFTIRSDVTMPRILVSNIDNEGMLADERAFTDAFCRASSITATRMAWFAEPGDIVVGPRDLSTDLKLYIARTMGYTPGAITFVTP